MGTIRFSQPSKIETLDDPVTHVKMRGSDAGIAQLVEHDLAKVGVASSSLVSRSKCTSAEFHRVLWNSAV